MKNLFLFLFSFLPVAMQAQDVPVSLRAGVGYAHDFPGLNGPGALVEVSRALSDKLDGGVGVIINNLQGYPRTKEVREFTKSASLQFHIYFLPLSDDQNQVRIGAGYGFSFYNIRRSFPLVTHEGGSTVTDWPVQDLHGRTSGFTLSAEYEYFIPNSNLGVGLRGSLLKAYDQVIFAGLFFGLRL